MVPVNMNLADPAQAAPQAVSLNSVVERCYRGPRDWPAPSSATWPSSALLEHLADPDDIAVVLRTVPAPR